MATTPIIKREVELLFAHFRERQLSPMTSVIVMAELLRAIGHIKREHDERENLNGTDAYT